MMKRIAFSAFACLGACAPSAILVDLQTGREFPVTVNGGVVSNSGRLTMDVDGETFSGPWVYKSDGGFIGSSFGSASMSTSQGTALGTGSATSVLSSTQGNGIATLSGSNGGVMRCRFGYSSMSGTGIGKCVDDEDRVYDLLID